MRELGCAIAGIVILFIIAIVFASGGNYTLLLALIATVIASGIYYGIKSSKEQPVKSRKQPKYMDEMEQLCIEYCDWMEANAVAFQGGLSAQQIYPNSGYEIEYIRTDEEIENDNYPIVNNCTLLDFTESNGILFDSRNKKMVVYHSDGDFWADGVTDNKNIYLSQIYNFDEIKSVELKDGNILVVYTANQKIKLWQLENDTIFNAMKGLFSKDERKFLFSYYKKKRAGSRYDCIFYRRHEDNIEEQAAITLYDIKNKLQGIIECNKIALQHERMKQKERQRWEEQQQQLYAQQQQEEQQRLDNKRKLLDAERQKWKDIHNKAVGLYGDEKVKKILYQFIYKADKKLKCLLDLSFLPQFESELWSDMCSYESDKEDSFEVLNQLWEESVFQSENRFAGTVGIFSHDEIVKKFKKERFNMLIEILKEEHHSEAIHHPYFELITYAMLWQALIDIKGEEVEKRYKKVLYNSNSLGIKDILKKIVVAHTDSFNTKDAVWIGSIVCYMMKKRKIEGKYHECYNTVSRALKQVMEKLQVENFRQYLLSDKVEDAVTMDDIDIMDGWQFEQFVADLFIGMGYRAEVTKKSGDQGIDVIVEKAGIKTGIQTKRFESVVGNAAVQEVIAGKLYYDCDEAMVITNSTFTKSAIELAKSDNVVLWDRDILKEKIRYRY